MFQVSVLRWSVWRSAEGLPTHGGWMAEGLGQSESLGLLLHLILSESFHIGKVAIDAIFQMRNLRHRKVE